MRVNFKIKSIVSQPIKRKSTSTEASMSLNIGLTIVAVHLISPLDRFKGGSGDGSSSFVLILN